MLNSIIDARSVKNSELPLAELDGLLSDYTARKVYGSNGFLQNVHSFYFSSHKCTDGSTAVSYHHHHRESLTAGHCRSCHEYSNQGLNCLKFGNFPFCGLLVEVGKRL